MSTIEVEITGCSGPLEKACFEIDVHLHHERDSTRMKMKTVATALAMECLHQGYVMGLVDAQKRSVT